MRNVVMCCCDVRAVCLEKGCRAVFSRMPDLRAHMQQRHPDVRYQCTQCSYWTIIRQKYDL